jgi:hypothetical protein
MRPEMSDGGHLRVILLSMVVLLDHIDDEMSDVNDSNGGRAEQRHRTGDAANNNNNVVRDMHATAAARDIAGSVSHY